ncbi:hypothetical protein CR513_26470, partial [Mucuna pruriens]
MDALKCHIPPFVGDEDVESYGTSSIRKLEKGGGGMQIHRLISNCMYQGSKGVEEYHKDIEVALIRANVLESNKETMACLLHGLNRDIQDIVELYYYVSMDDLVHWAAIKRCLTSWKTYANRLSNWKGKKKGKERPRQVKSPMNRSFIP